jgi:predicted TIM-barrel fold metal-dependent hydrolase
VDLQRRKLLAGLAATPLAIAAGCGETARYTQADALALDDQRIRDREQAGKGPFGDQRYQGYLGLSDLPYFELDDSGTLRCVVADLPPVLDIHAHLGMALLFAPRIDLQARHERALHLLDWEEEDTEAVLDLDMYINGNFTPSDLRDMRFEAVTQLLWGSRKAQTHTIPNLIAEMDATKVTHSVILPVDFGLPFGDNLTDRFMQAIEESGEQDRLIPGASVHPSDSEAPEKLARYAAAGARMVKLHPAMGRFFPDDEAMFPIYRACDELGLPVIFHGGRAGIEPEAMHQYTLMRHYEGAFRAFPNVQFVLGHAGARDAEDAITLAARHPNLWFDSHGQGVTMLARMLDEIGPDRLLFGTDWPFYHLASALAKVLIVTEDRPADRVAVLYGNAARLLGLS